MAENKKLLSELLREDILNSPYEDDALAKFYDSIENMSDEDLREYIYVNRDLFKQQFPAAIKDIPSLMDYVTIQPNWGVKRTDYDKMFNDEDILDNFGNLSLDEIDYVARRNGMNGKDLLADLTKAKIARDRYKIAHGEDLGGWFDSPASFLNNLSGAARTLFMRRYQEAMERGEDPSWKDILGDLGENTLYMAPWGTGAKIINSPIGRMAAGVASNAVTPLLTEAYDAAVYDDPENPRSEFSPTDVAVGAGVNMGTPLFLRGLGMKLDRMTGGKIGKMLQNLAEGESRQEFTKNLNRELGTASRNLNNAKGDYAGNVNERLAKSAKTYETYLNETPKSEQAMHKAMASEAGTTPNQQATEMFTSNTKTATRGAHALPDNAQVIVFENGKAAGTIEGPEMLALRKALMNNNKTYMWRGVEKQVPKEYKVSLNNNAANNYNFNSPYAVSQNMKTTGELVNEEALKNYLTNKAGDYTYSDESVNLPVVGSYLTKMIKEKNENEKREEGKKAAEKKHKINSMIKSLPEVDSVTLRTWQNGFKPHSGEELDVYNEYKKRGLI